MQADFQILKVASQVAGLAGLSVGVFLLLFRDFIRRTFFPTLSTTQAYRLLRLFLVLTFSLAALGVLTWAWLNSRPSEQLRIDDRKAVSRAYPLDSPAYSLDKRSDIGKDFTKVAFGNQRRFIEAVIGTPNREEKCGKGDAAIRVNSAWGWDIDETKVVYDYNFVDYLSDDFCLRIGYAGDEVESISFLAGKGKLPPNVLDPDLGAKTFEALGGERRGYFSRADAELYGERVQTESGWGRDKYYFYVAFPECCGGSIWVPQPCRVDLLALEKPAENAKSETKWNQDLAACRAVLKPDAILETRNPLSDERLMACAVAIPIAQ